MPSATLCFTGFSRDDLAKAQQLFAQANAETGARFELAPESEARVLVIDMDSMYGHMTWLKAADSGKKTVGVTTGDRCETDFMVKSPMTADALRGLLILLAADAPPSSARTTGQQEASPRTTGQHHAMPAFGPRTSGQQQAMPRTTGQQAAMPPAPAEEEPARAQHAAEYVAALTTGQMAALPKLVPHEPRISDYLKPGALGGPVKLQLPGAPVLALDPVSQTYVGSAKLKPLLPYVEAVIREGDLLAVSAAEFERIKQAEGGAQPYMRLLWLCGLSLGHGYLLTGDSPNKKFLLTKWPQVEREYPKHLRLATVMIKGPALVREIAEQTGSSESEVIDFVNAGLVTGAVVVEGSTASSDVPRAVALLAKPRPA